MDVIIVEDETAAGRRLEKLLYDLNPAISVLERLETVEDTVRYLKEHSHPELIFLDIHLADGSSFDIFEHIKPGCPVIFVTAYDEYALRAFKVNAIDYLLKPVKIGELKTALDKFQEIYTKRAAPVPDYKSIFDAAYHSERPAYLRRMLIRFGGSMKLVSMEDAAYFYSREKITFLVSRGSGKRLPVDHPLDKLETMLDPRNFFRINRQFIVNISSIREMHPYSKSRVKIDLEPPCDQETIVSTERSSEFKRWLVE